MGPGAATPGIWDLQTPAPDSPCRPTTLRAVRCATGHSGLENGQGPPRTRRPSKAPPRQNALALAPDCQRSHLGPPLRLPHNWRIGPAGLLGSNPNTGRPPRGPSQGAWCRNARIGDTLASMLDSPCCFAATRAAKGAAGHSRREYRQGPPSHSGFQRSPAPKCLGPRSRLTAISPRPAPPLAAQQWNRACRPPEGYPLH